MHIDKAFICLIITSNNFLYCVLELLLLYKTNFFVAVAVIRLRIILILVHKKVTHISNKHHLLWRKEARNGSHLESHLIKKPFQVEFFVYLSLSLFYVMSIAFEIFTIL